LPGSASSSSPTRSPRALAALVFAVRVGALTPVATDLGTLGGGGGSSAEGVSDTGVVIGIGSEVGGLPFIWTQAGGMVLPSLAGLDGFAYLTSVSANGIVGTGADAGTEADLRH
jgi:hypothetical protein